MKMFKRTARDWLISTAANLRGARPIYSAHTALEIVIQRPHDPGKVRVRLRHPRARLGSRTRLRPKTLKESR